MLAVWGILLGHVPTYCHENCCVPPRDYSVSQVIYLRGAGGLELHLEDIEDEVLDVDAVFRDPVDQSTYALYIGCGGCVASEDPLVAPRVPLNGYQPAELEPFTQTAYRSALTKAQRKFNVSRLSECDEGHFTIRLVDYKNSSSDIVWAPVIGLAESFTALELILFPVYILRNHGDVWNELGYTYWLWLFVGAPIVVHLHRASLGIPHLYQRWPWVSVREPLYELATIAFAAAGLEELTHLIYAQTHVGTVGGAFWVGLLLVIVFAQGAGTVFVYVTWRALRVSDKMPCAAHPLWAPLEIATGVSFLFLFGAGFYLGPAAIALAGCVRLAEMCRISEVPPAHTPRTVVWRGGNRV